MNLDVSSCVSSYSPFNTKISNYEKEDATVSLRLLSAIVIYHDVSVWKLDGFDKDTRLPESFSLFLFFQPACSSRHAGNASMLSDFWFQFDHNAD